MNEKIINYFDEYQQFMSQKIENMINPQFDTSNTKLKSFACVNANEIQNSIINIYINEQLFLYPAPFVRSIIFHEFTHILDANTIFKEIKGDKLSQYLNTYSEFHASQIEIITNLGFNKISDVKNKFDKNQKLYYKNELLDIDYYLVIPLADTLAIMFRQEAELMKLDEYNFYAQYLTMEKNLFYYLGKLSICKQYCKIQPHNFDQDFQHYLFYVNNIYRNAINKNYDTVVNYTNEFKQIFFALHGKCL